MAAPQQASTTEPKDAESREEIWNFYFPREWHVDCPLACGSVMTPFDFRAAPRGLPAILEKPNKGEAYVPVCRACRKKLRGVTVHEYVAQHKLAEPYGCTAPHPHIDDVVFNLGLIPVDQLIADSRTIPAIDRAIGEYHRLLLEANERIGKPFDSSIVGEYASHTLRAFLNRRCQSHASSTNMDYHVYSIQHPGDMSMRRMLEYLKDLKTSHCISRFTIEHLDRDFLRFLNNRILALAKFMRTPYEPSDHKAFGEAWTGATYDT